MLKEDMVKILTETYVDSPIETHSLAADRIIDAEIKFMSEAYLTKYLQENNIKLELEG